MLILACSRLVSGNSFHISPSVRIRRSPSKFGARGPLSVMLAGEIPAWAALSANGIAELILPEIVTDVVIAADPDPPGLIGARRAGRRWLAEGRNVVIVTPGRGVGVDFNDLLRM